jgi:predicted DNA-binding transcriptional regulator AlpA
MNDHADRPRVVGTAEVAAMLGVSAARVRQLSRRADWPEPLEVLATGKVWLRRDVEQWMVEHPERRPGRPSRRADE